MGEVYRARDSKLDRDVAIKVLPAALARNPDRLARFEREAKVLAAMNHPNIAIIHGLEDAPNNSRGIVMELVEGPTLAERIKQGAIPMDEALKISQQIADALEAAHEKGVVHRDLKPANVKVREDGTVKVLDFGLATAVQAGAREPGDGAESPTLTMGATEAGVILGTASYMAPEQARGLKVDKRADIWAFGVVFFEMLTGKRLFRGADVSDTLAGVLREEIDFSRAPARVRRLLRRCLQRDPKQRLRDIGEARFLLEEASADAPTEKIPATRSGMWAAAAILFLIAFAALAAVHFRETPPQQPNVRFQVQPPDKGGFGYPRLSPDGRLLAFVAKNQLWIHSFDSFQSHPIPGTEGASFPFWSPDSATIGFFAGGSLKKIASLGGSAQILAPALNGVGGTWSHNDVILFGPNTPSVLFKVSAAGGLPVQVTKAEGSVFHFHPEFLPDGNHFLFNAYGEKQNSGIYAASLDGTTPVRLLPEVASAIFSDGHLLFRRGETLMAQPFDPEGLHLAGDAFPIAEQVSGALSYGAFSLSQTGVLAYVGGASAGTVQLAWTDQAGKSLALFGPPGAYMHFRLAPDEKRIAYDVGNNDVWVLDSVRGVPSRLTFDSATDNLPMWSPDGQRIVWPSHRSGAFDLYIKAANGTGSEELLIKMGTPTGWATDWSRDGLNILYQRPGEKTGQDLWIAPQPSSGGGDPKPFTYLNTQFDEEEGRFSPDGKWVAYTSNESGISEIYVQSFPLSDVKSPISTGGGSEPQWSKDGAELFYLSADRTLMAVPISRSAAEPFKPGLPKALFRVPPVLITGLTARSYAVSNDSKRFLISNGDGTGNSPPLTVILNWRAGIKK
jgi:serine/threonine protein kinase